MVEEHLEESKRQISELAEKIMLNDGDLEIDKRNFAPMHQKLENMILSDYLTDLANERLTNLEVFISDEKIVDDYREKFVAFLRDTVREKL